jgi:hypothetical protein
VFRSLFGLAEELTLLVLPHGGQRTARRNAWRAATDLHVEPAAIDPRIIAHLVPRPASAPAPVAVGAQR